MFFVVGERAMKDETCVLSVQRYHDDCKGSGEESARLYDRVRVPWDEAEIVLLKLGVGNMQFGDCIDRKRDVDENRW